MKILTFRTAIIFLLVWSVFGLPAFLAEVARSVYPENLPLVYLANSLTLISSIIALPILAAFVLLGSKVKNNLIKVTSFLCMLCMLFSAIAAIYMLVEPGIYVYENLLLSLSVTILVGFLSVFFGIGLIQAKDKIERYSLACGILNILVGICFILILPIYLGLLLLPPLTLLESFILSDAARKYDR